MWTWFKSSVLFDCRPTTRTMPCPFLFFNYPGARLLEDPHLNNRVLFTTAFS